MSKTPVSVPSGDDDRHDEPFNAQTLYELCTVEHQTAAYLMMGQGACHGCTEAQYACEDLQQDLGRFPTLAEMRVVYERRLKEVVRQLSDGLIYTDWFHGWNRAYLAFIQIRCSSNLSELLASDPLDMIKQRIMADAGAVQAKLSPSVVNEEEDERGG
jgi:hypothetical protein